MGHITLLDVLTENSHGNCSRTGSVIERFRKVRLVLTKACFGQCSFTFVRHSDLNKKPSQKTIGPSAKNFGNVRIHWPSSRYRTNAIIGLFKINVKMNEKKKFYVPQQDTISHRNNNFFNTYFSCFLLMFFS